jgi:3',5'-cyclic AMP phosphodiesterase CpdA
MHRLVVLLLLSSAVSAQTLYPAKAIHQPTPVPDRVILTWSDTPSTTQSVTWRTDTTVTKALGQIAKSTDGPEFDPLTSKTVNAKLVTTVPAKTQALTTTLNSANYHSLTFTELEPDSKYVYRVGDGINFSEWYQFRTPSAKPEPLEFIYFGDAQNDIKRHWSRVVRGAFTNMPKAKFIVHAGDLINSATKDDEWGEWHTAAGWINGMIPTVPTPGNHEYGRLPLTPLQEEHYTYLSVIGSHAGDRTLLPKSGLTQHWRAQFTLPEQGPKGLEETCYSLDIQGVRIISLNSNEKQAEQIPWLEEQLANNPNRWTVVTFHHPIYSPAKGRDNADLRNKWRPVFDKYHVDLVLTGHDHTYGRTGLMIEDNVMSGSMAYRGGTVYCVSVSGPKLYNLGETTKLVIATEQKQLYQLIRVDGSKLHYEARTAADEVFDEFELRKQPDGRNILVERKQLKEERKAGWRTLTGRDMIFAVLGMLLLAGGAFLVRKLWKKREKS